MWVSGGSKRAMVRREDEREVCGGQVRVVVVMEKGVEGNCLSPNNRPSVFAEVLAGFGVFGGCGTGVGPVRGRLSVFRFRSSELWVPVLQQRTCRSKLGNRWIWRWRRGGINNDRRGSGGEEMYIDH